MAWMNQERKAALAEGLKKVMPKGWKYSLAVRHHSTLVLTISEAPIDLVAQSLCSDEQKKRGYIDVNQYHIDGVFSGSLLETFTAIRDAMMVGNHDNSDPQTDYFDVGWYIDINVGKWDKPFRCSTAPMMDCDKCHAETIDVRRRENGSKLCDLCSEARLAEIADIKQRLAEMGAQRAADCYENHSDADGGL
jgi:hypothetical protein